MDLSTKVFLLTQNFIQSTFPPQTHQVESSYAHRNKKSSPYKSHICPKVSTQKNLQVSNPTFESL